MHSLRQYWTHSQKWCTLLPLSSGTLPCTKHLTNSPPARVHSLPLLTARVKQYRGASQGTAIFPAFIPPAEGKERGVALSKARYSSSPLDRIGKVPFWPLLGFGTVLFFVLFLLGGRKRSEGSDARVSKSVRRELLRAERMLQKRDYAQAEKACHNALGLLMRSEHAEKRAFLETRAVTMDRLANIYFDQMKLAEAEMMFKEALFVMLSIGTPKDDDAAIEISLKLAKIYNNQKRYEEAEVGLDWCVDAATKKLDTEKSPQRYGMLGLCLQARAQYHQMHRNYDRAMRDFSQTVDIAEAVQNPLQVAIAYSNLATAVDGARDYSRAVGLVAKSLEAVEQIRLQQDKPRSSQGGPNDVADDVQSETAESPPTPSDQDHQYTETELDYYAAIFRTNLGIIHANNGHSDLALAAYEKAEVLAVKCKDQQLLNQIHFGRAKASNSPSKKSDSNNY